MKNNSLLKKYIRTLLLEKRLSPEEKARRAEARQKERDAKRKAALEGAGWQPWPDFVLDVSYNPTIKGTGPGEDRLAVIFDGEVQGGSVPYDIVDSEGKRWEVKELKSTSDTVRPGVEGRAAISDEVFKIKSAWREINKVCDLITKHNLKIEDFFGAELGSKIKEFMSGDDVKRIYSGEITQERMEKLYNIIKGVAEIYKSGEEKEKNKYVELGDKSSDKSKRVDVSNQTLASIGKKLGLDREDMGITDDEVVSSQISNEAFIDPEKWLVDVWDPAAWPSEVFGDVEGVIVVNPTHYRIIDNSNLNDELEFKSISGGVPKFGLK